MVLTMLISVGICFIGLQVNQRRQYNQRVTYAQTAIKTEKSELENIGNKVDDLYLTDQKDFLNSETTTNDVSNLKTNLESIKVTGTDFNIKDSSLPPQAKEMAKLKEVISKQLIDASDKLQLQEDTDKLFLDKLPNWQKSTDDLLIKDDLSLEEISKTKEKLTFFEDDKWKELADQYLSFAIEQVEKIQMINKKIDEGAISTYDDYLTLLDDIDSVKNEKNKTEFEKIAEKIAEDLGITQDETSISSEEDYSNEELDSESDYQESDEYY